MLIFQIKRIISSEKWCNYVVTFSFFENAKNFGRSDDAKRRKKRRMALCIPQGGGAEDWGVLKFLEGKGGMVKNSEGRKGGATRPDNVYLESYC